MAEQPVSEKVKRRLDVLPWWQKALYLAAGLIAIAAYIALLRRGAWFVLPGIALGIALVLSGDTRKVLDPVISLAAALLPLALPLLVVLAVGTIAHPWWVQLAVIPLAFVASWVCLIAPGSESSREPLKDAGRWFTGQSTGIQALIVAVVFALIAAALFPWWLHDKIVPAQDRAGWSTDFLNFALLAWMAAILLRTLGYANSWLKLPAALFAAALLIRLAVLGGIFPGHEWADEQGWLDPGVMLAALAIVLGLTAAAQLLAMVFADKGPEEMPSRVIGSIARVGSALGFVICVVAAVAIFVTAAVGAIEQRTYGSDAPLPETLASAQPPAALTPGQIPKTPDGDLFLAQQYSPVLQLTADERWQPESVKGFLHRSWLIKPEGEAMKSPHLADLPVECPPFEKAPCYTLTIGERKVETDEHGKERITWLDCAPGDEPCAGAHAHQRCCYRGPAYIRVVHAGMTEEDGSPDPFKQVTTWIKPAQRAKYFRGRIPSTLIQYWLFYPYDEWNRPTITGQLYQRHEADWEAVSVGLDEAGPLFVAYSAHCGGTWEPWSEVRVSDAETPRIHPLVAVAQGSHANYPHAEEQHAPDSLGCAKNRLKGATTLLTYASNVRDETGSDWTWRPNRLIPASALELPMSFKGIWGPTDGLEIVNQRSIPIPTGKGPASPPLQDLWAKPIEKIFCGKNSEPRTC